MLTDKPKKDGQITLRIPSVTPLFTYGLMVTLLVLLIGGLNWNPEQFSDNPVLLALGLQGDAVINRLDYYRLFTALLVIATPTGNGVGSVVGGFAMGLVTLYSLYIVGIEMEKLWGSPRTILIYTLGGASGCVVSLLLVPLRWIPPDLTLAAATGGVLAMIGAEMVYLYKHRRLYRAMVRRRQAFLIGLIVINLIVSAFSARIDLIGTVFALIGGGVLAAFVSPYMLPRQHPDDPTTLLAEDVNPLRGRSIAVAVYTLVLMSLVALAVNLA